MITVLYILLLSSLIYLVIRNAIRDGINLSNLVDKDNRKENE